jgi:hypothetical protein
LLPASAPHLALRSYEELLAKAPEGSSSTIRAVDLVRFVKELRREMDALRASAAIEERQGLWDRAAATRTELSALHAATSPLLAEARVSLGELEATPRGRGRGGISQLLQMVTRVAAVIVTMLVASWTVGELPDDLVGWLRAAVGR